MLESLARHRRRENQRSDGNRVTEVERQIAGQNRILAYSFERTSASYRARVTSRTPAALTFDVDDKVGVADWIVAISADCLKP